MKQMNKKIPILFISMLCLFASCIEERLEAEKTDEPTAYLLVKGGSLLSSTDSRDNEIKTLRILAFRVSGQCVSNVLYNATLHEIIEHPIDDGIYNFVFLANEPTLVNVQNALNTVTTYSDLGNITYPESVFRSDIPIPMFQKIENVEVLPKKGGVKVNGGLAENPLLLKLDRLASRVDIVLEAEEDMTAYFTGVTFSGIPDGIKLMSDDNGTFNRTKTRKYTLVDDAGYFSNTTAPTVEQQGRGIKWAMKITRFILPFNKFTPVDNPDKAFELTVDMENRYSPSCKLKIVTNGVGGATKDNYTLPLNTALLLTGVIKVPLELNVEVTPWGEKQSNWQAGNRYLNVSEINVNITDFNGARIIFSSNMPVVRVLPDVYVNNSTTQTLKTENVFNDLVLAAGETSTTRFAYTYDAVRGEGTGYMDILLDEYNMDIPTFLANQNGRHTTFGLVLSAEDENGGNQLQREITVNTSQYGIRFLGDHWNGNAYIGAFHRENEVGERVITAQLPRLTNQNYKTGNWSVVVDEPYKNWIILSTTPSFDPYIGTDTPGDPEKHPVRPNEYKTEEVDNNGTRISGKGRIYFRVGWREPLKLGGTGKETPRYATVTATYTTPTGETSHKIYIRQGEADDYVMNTNTPITSGPLRGKTRSYARKFSAFNLTHPNFKDQDESYTGLYASTTIKQAAFVRYPTQAGALYQWGLNKANNSLRSYFRRAYHPTKPNYEYSSSGYWMNDESWLKMPIWGSSGLGSTAEYEYGYESVFEICPAGYHRPSDGYTNQISYNGPAPNIKNDAGKYVNLKGIPVTQTDYSSQIETSEWRQSLWKNPWRGETGSGRVMVGEGTANQQYANRERSSPANNTTDIPLLFGFYADGYYDRRPMKVQVCVTTVDRTQVGVSINSPSVAYKGVVIYNPENKASIFFPASGRRRDQNGYLEYVGETGYYWSSSTAPLTPTYIGQDVRTAWAIEMSGWNPGHVHTLPTFGQSVRCVVNTNE